LRPSQVLDHYVREYAHWHNAGDIMSMIKEMSEGVTIGSLRWAVGTWADAFVVPVY
jgi:hypothetical protein